VKPFLKLFLFFPQQKRLNYKEFKLYTIFSTDKAREKQRIGKVEEEGEEEKQEKEKMKLKSLLIKKMLKHVGVSQKSLLDRIRSKSRQQSLKL
jgi:hypothetical protein